MTYDSINGGSQTYFEGLCMLSATHGEQMDPFRRRLEVQRGGRSSQHSLRHNLPIRCGQLINGLLIAIG